MSFIHSIGNIKKVVISLMILLCVYGTFPKTTNAQYVDISNALKEYGLDTLAYQVTNQVIKKITAQTLDWINSGFEGRPAFLEDPDQFFLDTADTAVSDLLSGTQLNRLCSPFKAEVRLALVKNYLSNNENLTCTLSKVKDNYDAFMDNFDEGGWDGWFEVTQTDSNNPYGAYLQAQTQLTRTVDGQIAKYNTQLSQSKGFLSFEQCPRSGEITQAMIDENERLVRSGALRAENNALQGKKVGDCTVAKQTVTPGSVIENQLNNVLGGPLARLQNSDEINEILGALLNQLTEQIVGKIGSGLRGLGKSSGGEPSYADQLRNDPQIDTSDLNPGEEGGPLVTCVTGEDGIMRCKAESGNSGIAACTTIGTGHGNDAGAPATIDPANIVFEMTDVSTWAQNGSLNGVVANNDTIRFEHDRPGNWTPFDVRKEPNDQTFSSAWILVWRKNPPALVISDQMKTSLTNLRDRTVVMRLLVNSSILVPGANSINRAKVNQIKSNYEDRDRLNDAIEIAKRLEGINSSTVLSRISLMNDLQTSMDSYIQFLDSIVNDVRAQDVTDQRKQADAILSIADRLLPILAELINPPPAGSGKWHAVPFTYLTLGKPNEREVDYAFCGGIGGARTLSDFAPTAGDTYGFMLSTPARDSVVVGNSLNAKERSNIIQYTWPGGIVRPKPTGALPTPAPIPGGGGGHCSAVAGSVSNYGGALSSAQSAVLSSDPTFANSINNTGNSIEFINRMISQLRGMGYQASGAKNGNDVHHPEHTVAIWQNTDTLIERYEAVNHAGDSDMTMSQAAQVEFNGDIPADCSV